MSPDDSPFSARMKEIDDAAPAPGLATVFLSWGCLLAALVAAGAIAFAVGPYFMDDHDGGRRYPGKLNERALREDTRDDAVFRTCLGGIAGGLLGLGFIAALGGEDLKAAWKKSRKT